MSFAPILALASIAALAFATRRTARATAPPSPTPSFPTSAPNIAPSVPSSREAVTTLITEEARAVGLDPRIALAFAEIESGLNPSAEGDKRWPLREDGRLYQEHVLNNPDLARNPARLDPSAWHAYGLFQLLAPFHVLPEEHPRALLDPRINARRGVRAIRSAVQRSGGNLIEARRRYVGCPPERNPQCSPAVLAHIDQRWREALQRWGIT